MKPLRLTIAILFILSLTACGGSIAPDDVPLTLTLSHEGRGDAILPINLTNEPTIWHNLLNSKSYSGHIAVMFKDGTDVRLHAQELTSLSGADLNKVIKSISSRPSVRVRRGLPQIPEEKIELARENAAKAGVELYDWNLYYTIEVADPDEAEALVEELKNDPSVRWVHPIPISEPAGVITTPDLSGEQNYLYPNETHGGLNIIAGWEAGATGEGVVVVDEETNWNFDHEDLPIDADPTCINATEGCLDPNTDDRNYIPDYPMPPEVLNSFEAIQHGTAVVGLIGGLDNGGGIKGIAPSAVVKLFQVTAAAGDPFIDLVIGGLDYWLGEDGKPDKIKPGDIILVELQSPGPTTTSGCDVGSIPGEEGTGCVPVEVYSTPFAAIKQAVDSGFIVIEGAGNGSLDLSSPEAHFEGGPDLSVESSGAIMVGASLGAGHEKAPWTNCGWRVDVFGWGAGVVTTGYGDHPASTAGDPNKWYTAQFGGTSSATAIVGGAVALIQSYVKKVYTDTLELKGVESAFFTPEIYPKPDINASVYLTPAKMKELLIASGVPAVGDGTCKIGVQPDVSKAIELINNGTIVPYIKTDIVNAEVKPVSGTVVSGIRYDMDGDGRAELISFSRDHKFYVDLSSIQPPAGSPDGYGAWDLVLEAGMQGSTEARMLFPVIHDYNSDGRADLALYDSINGLWYIKYTTPSLLVGEGGGEGVIVWDRVIDYSTDPAWKAYSRPVPGDYDGDHWLDLALQTSDGHWVIDYGGVSHVVEINDAEKVVKISYTEQLGTFDKDVKYLTDEQLAEAPGWAWATTLDYIGADFDYGICIAYRIPDGLISAGDIYERCHYNNFELFDYDFPAIYGNNDDILIAAPFFSGGPQSEVSLKTADGVWDISNWDNFLNIPPLDGYGDILCRPALADFNGDGKTDRAVQCGTTWKIAYSGATDFRVVELDQAIDPLPAYVYQGGIKYQDVVALYNYYKFKLPCSNGSLCTKSDTIFDVQPPIGPYFAECIKYWAPKASYCWDK